MKIRKKLKIKITFPKRKKNHKTQGWLIQLIQTKIKTQAILQKLKRPFQQKLL